MTEEEIKINAIGSHYVLFEMAAIESKHLHATFQDLTEGIRQGRELELINVFYNYILLQKELIEQLASQLPMPEPVPIGGFKN